MQKSKKLTPFSAEYWRSAVSEFNLRKLVIAALFTALAVAVSGFSFRISENLFIMFTFLVIATGTVIYGPCVGVMVAIATDLLTWLIFQSAAYPFFVGYTISEVCCALVYSFLLYRSRLTVVRLFAARFTVNLFINVALGSVWSAMLYSKGYYYFFAQSLIKNSILLVIETALLYFVMQAVIPIAQRFGLVSKDALSDSGMIKFL